MNRKEDTLNTFTESWRKIIEHQAACPECLACLSKPCTEAQRLIERKNAILSQREQRGEE